MAAITKIWRVHSVELVPNGETALDGNNVTIPAITSARLVSNGSVQKDTPSNKIFPSSGRIEFGAFDLEVTTLAAKHMTVGFGNDLALCIGGASPNLDSVVVYLAEFDCSGQKGAATGVHRSYTIQKGAIYYTSMQCDHRGDLQFTFRVSAVRGGTGDANAAVVLTEGTNLPTDAQLNTTESQYSRWTLGDSTDTEINDVPVGSKRSVSADFGPSVRTEGADSDIADSILLIETFSPVITANGIEPEWFDHKTTGGLELGIEGASVIPTTTYFKFRQRAGAGFAAEATNWLQMGVNGIAHYSEIVAQSGLEPATAAVQIDAIADATYQEPVIWTEL